MTSSSSTPTSPAHRDTSAASESDRFETGTVRVGVLSPHNSTETKAILNAVRALGHDPVWIRDENVRSWIRDGNVELSPHVDVLVNRLLVSKSDRRLADLGIAGLYEAAVPVINPPQAVGITVHKYGSAVRLAEAGVPVPDAYIGRSPGTFDDRDEVLPGTVAHKRTIGTNGKGMSVVSPDEAANPTIANEDAFLQEFLDTGGDRHSDIRAYVVGDRLVGAMRRTAPDGEWRTNVALGADVEDVTDTLDPGPRRLARTATAVLGLDVTGVDLVAVDDGWQILEVNPTAGFKGLYSATGRSPAPNIALLAIERAGGTVDGDTVRSLAATLDNSVPDCKPRAGDGDSDEPLGYTTEVRVSGTSEVVTTVAKSDTGAARTSIDTELAGRTGAGPLEGTIEVRTGTRTGTETRPLVELDLQINGTWQSITASVTDRSGMRYPVLLGRDVLANYTVNVGERIEE